MLRSTQSLVILGLALASPAWGHGEADWIMDGHYTDRHGAICCNVGTDCLPTTEGEVIRIEGGWKHVPTNTVLMDGDPGIHESKDPRGRTFRCVRAGQFKCYFPGISI